MTDEIRSYHHAMSRYFRTPTGSPFCGVCGHTVPEHYADCPVLTGEPQQGSMADTGPEQGNYQPPQWQSDQYQGHHGWHELQPPGFASAARSQEVADSLRRIATALERLIQLWEEHLKTEKK